MGYDVVRAYFVVRVPATSQRSERSHRSAGRGQDERLLGPVCGDEQRVKESCWENIRVAKALDDEVADCKDREMSSVNNHIQTHSCSVRHWECSLVIGSSVPRICWKRMRATHSAT